MSIMIKMCTCIRPLILKNFCITLWPIAILDTTLRILPIKHEDTVANSESCLMGRQQAITYERGRFVRQDLATPTDALGIFSESYARWKTLVAPPVAVYECQNAVNIDFF